MVVSTYRRIALVLLIGTACRVPVARADTVEPAHFHHVRLNSTDPNAAMKYYVKHFGAVPIKYRNGPDALFVERSFLLFNKVDSPPPRALVSGIWHMGWGGVDIVHEYEWMKKKGVDFHTPPTPLIGADNFYMYINGPSGELIEINTMGHHRFAHVHFFCDDVNETTSWYVKHLGLASARKSVPKPKGNMDTLLGIWMNIIRCDNVTLIYFGKPDAEPPPRWWPDAPLKELQPTRGRPIDHIAFSYRNIQPVYERMQAAGVEIVEHPTFHEDLKMKSFSVLAPDQVLVEIVEDRPIPEGIWD